MCLSDIQGPVVQSVVSLTSSLRAISKHICVSLDVNFNKSLTNDVVSFEQLGPGIHYYYDDGLNAIGTIKLYIGPWSDHV